jgi:Beta-propeller repeat/Divergent InlB B-repeat domain
MKEETMLFENQLAQRTAGTSVDIDRRRNFMSTKRRSDRPSLPVFLVLSLCVSLAMCVSSQCADQPAAANSAATQRARASFGNLPLTFEPNQGQADSQIKYMTHWHGYSLFLTPNEAVFAMPIGPQNSALLDVLGQKQSGPSGMTRTGSAVPAPPRAESVIRMTMPGANSQPVITSEDQQPGVKNYFIGNDPKKWHTNIPAFARVRYHDVYPGVDVVYHGAHQLEFDMIVRAGADPDKIALNFAGAQRLSTDDAGNLILTTEAGELRLQHPVSYQEKSGTRQAVDSRFVVKNDHQVVFALGSYDRSRELVIDPSISFATYFGAGGTNGSGEETGLGIAVDASGNAYVVGTTNSSTALPGPTPLVIPPGGQYDCYVVEFNSSGVIVFTTIFGGTQNDQPQAVAVDSTGIYVTGVTESKDFPVTAGAAQPAFGGAGKNGNGDAFVAKLATDGSSITWATYLGGTDFDEAFAMAVDNVQDVFVVGETYSTTGFPVVNALLQGSANNGSADGFVTEVKPDGTAFLMSSYIGGVNIDFATGVAWNLNTGNVYVSGGTQSPNLPFTAGAFQQQCGTGALKNCNETTNGQFLDDGFVAAFAPGSTTYTYFTYLGGGGVDDALAIATDSTGDAYVTGKTASGGSGHFPVLNAYQSTLSGVQNAFVTQLNPTGTALVYSTYLGGEGLDKGLGIALDSVNDAYVTGQTTSTKFPVANPTQPNFGGGTAGQFDSDAFLSELNYTGSTLTLPFSTYIGGTGDEDIQGGFVAVDSTGNDIYVVGDTNSTNFPIQASAGKVADSTLNGGEGSTPQCQVLDRQTGQTLTVVCPDAFVNLYTANTDGLLVTLAGTGGGTVTSSPAGITCPGVGTCSASFPHPTPVTVTATPNANSVFTSWSGAGCSGTAPCAITLSSNQFVTATFTAVSANLSVTIVGTGTVTSTPAGINCATGNTGTCVAAFPIGAQVTLAATPGTGFTFAGWSGACSGTTCVLTMNSDQAATATFKEPSLSVTVTGSGTVTSSPAGITCPGTCAANFPAGTKVTLTPKAATNSVFTAWSGGGCTGTAACTITLNSDQAVSAMFGNFTIAASALSPASVAAGGSATSTITLTSNGGFDVANVALSCGVTPVVSPAPTCAFGAISGGKSTLTVKTTPATSGSLKSSPFRRSGPLYAMFLPIGGMLFLGAGLGANARKKKLLGLLLIGLMLSGLVFLVGCGGGSSSGGGGGGGGGGTGTPAGKYTITVTGSASGITQTANPLTLTVQ